MTRDRIIDRIQKLLALAESPNEHEAAHAKRRANSLKRKYKIRAAELKGRESRRADAGPESRDPYWRTNLAMAVGDRWKCASLRKDGRLWFEGKAADRAAGQYAYLAAETVRACHALWRKELRGHVGSLYRVWSTTFKAEAVRAIAERLAGRTAIVPAVVVASVQVVQQAVGLGGEEPPKKPGPKSPDEIQLERARREVEELVADLTASVGPFGAQTFAAQVVERAGRAGRSFGLRVYLGDGERLLAGYSVVEGFLERAARAIAEKVGLR